MSEHYHMPDIIQEIPATKSCEHETRCPLCFYDKIQEVLESILKETIALRNARVGVVSIGTQEPKSVQETVLKQPYETRRGDPEDTNPGNST